MISVFKEFKRQSKGLKKKKLPEWQEIWVTARWPSEPGWTEDRPSMPPPVDTYSRQEMSGIILSKIQNVPSNCV